MKESQFKPIVKKVLEKYGLKVHNIEEKEGQQTPDFYVVGKGNEYIIELKIKGDDPIEIESDEEALKRGQLVSKRIPIGPRNRLAAIIGKGVQQMADYDPMGQTFHVIWLHSSGNEPELLDRRFRSTLYGTAKLFSLRINNVISCYYFHESAFYSWRDHLDGAILTYMDKIQLCLNTQSPRANEFRNSDLSKITSKGKGLFDPVKLEEQYTDVMLADCDIDRKKIDEVMGYLQGKYCIDHLQIMPMHQLTGMIAVSAADDS